MYRVFALMLIFLSTTLFAKDYEGHYRVSSPKNEIDFDAELAKQQKNAIYDENGNIIGYKNAKKVLSKAERARLAREKAERERLLREREQNEAKLARLRAEQEERNRLLLEQAMLKQQREEALRKQRGSINYFISSPEEENTTAKKPLVLKDKDFGLEKNESTLPVDRSRIITNDRYIVGILENSVDTQLAGRLIIVVEDDIFGGDGRKILLPKGSRMVCQYKSLEEGGQTRVPIECLRILRPDGASIILTNAIVADQMGRTGGVGKVDNRLWEKYGQAIGLSGLSGANTYTSFVMGMSNNPHVVAGAPILQSTNNTLSEVTKKLIEKSMALAPIVNIAKGSRVVLMPQTDIFIKSVVPAKEEKNAK